MISLLGPHTIGLLQASGLRGINSASFEHDADSSHARFYICLTENIDANFVFHATCNTLDKTFTRTAKIVTFECVIL